MTLNELLNLIDTQAESIRFEAVIDVINSCYHYTLTAFSNGLGEDRFLNEAGSNEGSCRVFAFAKAQGLSQQQTLHCFGQYYHHDVLQNPEGNDHANIRNFMRYGWDGIVFHGVALTLR